MSKGEQEASNPFNWLTADGPAFLVEFEAQEKRNATASGHESPVRLLAHLLPPESRAYEPFKIKRCIAVQHVVDRATEPGGEDS